MDPECIPFYLLQQITDNFSEERKLGTGTYGEVYKGVRENGEEIAVKKLRHFNLELDDKQFEQEYNNLKTLQHPNIVRFVGYCYETQNRPHVFNGKQIFAGQTYRALCFEYLHNGSLHEHLSDELDWHTRYKIIKGTCEGLRYIHVQTEPILHLDLKPGNILLDMDMVPKLADFGLSRIIGKELTSTITQSPQGTFGYLPPEFIEGQVISKEFDIFSLGVVMIKIVTGPEGFPKYEGKPSEEFVDQVQQKWRNMLQATWSGSLLEAYCQQVKRCIQIASNCLEDDRHKRPKIKNIIDKLDELETEISELQSCWSMVLNQLNVEPLHLRFLSEPNKSLISCSLHLTNNTDDRVAFRLQIENLKEYFLGPLCGVVTPRSCYTLAVTMRNKLKLLPEFFILESAIADFEELTDFSSYTAVGELDQFFTKAKQDGRQMQHMKLAATYVHTEIIPRHYPGLNPVDVHPTEPWLLINISRSVHIWNYETQEMVDYYHVKERSPVQDAKFIAREQWFVAGNRHGFIHVFSYNTKEETKSFEAHGFSVICLDIHPTKPYMLSAGHDHLIKLWDWGKDWECVGIINMQSGGRGNRINHIHQVKFNPKDANNFACASIDGLLQIRDISSPTSAFPLSENESVACFDYITRGDQVYLITVSWDSNARIWDFGKRKCVQILEGHTDCVCTVLSHPDHPILIMGSNDGTISLWNSITFRLEGIRNFGLGMVSAVACLKGTKRIVIVHDDGIALTEIYQEPPEESL